ncbi:MAG: hypothetical protein ACYCW6_30170 [Candidatus Xenobia bacterium]
MAVGTFNFAADIIAGELVRLVNSSLGSTLGLNVYQTGRLNSLPAPENIDSFLNALFCVYGTMAVRFQNTDAEVGDVIAGVGVKHEFELVYFRKQSPTEAVDDLMIQSLQKIGALFLLPSNIQLPNIAATDGLSVVWAVPSEYTLDHPLNAIFDTEEYQTSVGSVKMEVQVTYLPTTS